MEPVGEEEIQDVLLSKNSFVSLFDTESALGLDPEQVKASRLAREN